MKIKIYFRKCKFINFIFLNKNLNYKEDNLINYGQKKIKKFNSQ